jgi:hypothetical protein
VKIALTFVSIACFAGCKNSNRSNGLGLVNKGENLSAKANPDSVKIVGEGILEGEYIGGKNEKYILPLMDSLDNKRNRSFYFKVFGKITEQADGYIAEAIGSHALKYFESAPMEFIQNSKFISDSTFNLIAYATGVEISLSSDNLAKAEEEFEKLRTGTITKCKGISESNKLKLDQFFTRMRPV